MEEQKMREHHPTEELRRKVEDFAVFGYTHQQIADYLEIDEKTLKKHYKHELVKPLMDKNIVIGNSLYHRALKGDPQAQEFWLKTRGRWSFAKSAEEIKQITDSFLETFVKHAKQIQQE